MAQDRSDRQSGYLPDDQLGSCQRWVSTKSSSHLIVSIEVGHTRDRRDTLAAPPAADTERSPVSYVAALAPIIFGTTYLLTSQFLPPGRPLLAALMRSLPTGLVLIIGSRLPPRRWLVRFFVLSVLYCSALFPLLFLAAYRLPGRRGRGDQLAQSPILVVVISVPLLGHLDPGAAGRRPGSWEWLGSLCWCCARARGWTRSESLAMVGAVTMMGTATVLTKRWGRPPGMSSIGVTGWTFLFGGSRCCRSRCLRGTAAIGSPAATSAA